MTASSRILCVDDNKDTLEMIDLLLHQSDDSYSITLASTAEHALEQVKQQSFDLFIFDFRLPEMTGVELCHNIRKTDTLTPIMFFTARAYNDDREAAMKAGASDYLIKPNDLSRFTQTVKKLLKKNSSTFDYQLSIKTYTRDSIY